MSGQILKRRGGGKAKFNSKKFKNAFSFKQQDQKKRLQSHQEEESTTNSSAAKKKKRYRKAASPTDDSSTVCSDDKESILIFPTVQRLTASSPPLTIGQQKNDNGFFGIERSLSLRRSSSRGISSSARSAPPSIQNRSPYQSRKEKKNLPETLKSCRRSTSSSSGRVVNDKYTMNESASAWERRQVSGSRVNSSQTFSKSFGGYSMINEDEVFAIRQTKSDSSNGSFLPSEVTPANKFVPIGLEDEGCDDVPFNEEDYDICILPISEDEEADKSVAKTQVVKTKNKKKATTPTTSEDTEVKSKAQDLDKYQHEQDRYSLPPSPVSTGDTDWTSLESKDTEEETNCYGGFNLGTAAEHELSPICKGSDKYCVAASEYYPNDNEWVAYARQEIMRLSSLFTSDCSS